MSKENLINTLNSNLADIAVLYVKLHNYHWNVKGPQFFEVHKVTESYYEYFAEKYDELAERILQLGSKPFSSMKEYLENATIKEETGNDFSTGEVLKSVLSDFNYLVKKLRNTSDVASIEKDNTTVNMIDDIVQWLEKNIWMLNATVA